VSANVSDVDLLQQALTNSGLSNGSVVSTATSSVTQSGSLAASSCTQKDDGSLSAFDETPRRPKLSYVSTMAVHDSVTGMIRRHPVRKVCLLSRCYSNSFYD